MAEDLFLACDWGSTNLRAWVLDSAGRVHAKKAFPLGVSSLAPGEARRRFDEEVRPALAAEALPAILCGAVGSNLGWLTTPYVPCPARLADLATRLVAAEANPAPTWIVPGVSCEGFNGQGDVMRGEETQLFGWLALDPTRAKARHVVCHPGTHSKWVLLEESRLVRFVSTLTGELFGVLRRHSILRSQAPPDEGAAFAEGLEAAGDGDALAARLFTARARVVGRGAPPETTASYLSGVLIGAEVAAAPRLLGLEPLPSVVLLGDGGLCRLYARALAARGVESEIFDGDAAAMAGLSALHGLRVSG